jgi:plasmid replication initiation protein
MTDESSNLAKIIQLEDYDRSLGIDELNLAEFPLAALADRNEPGKNTLLFEDKIFDEGANREINRSLVIAGSDHYGLPTSTDSDILLLLVHLTNVRNGFKSKRVEFSRYELIKFLGWSDDGRSYKRLDEALQRWTSVTLHYKHAWWQRSGQKWRSRSFHIIETLELRSRDDRDEGLSAFTWNEVIFESFTSGNLRRIDLDVYFKLESAISRQMFRFLDKRFYRSRNLSFDLKVFAFEHVGLSRNYDIFEVKRKLDRAIEELEAIGFLDAMGREERYTKIRRGEWEVHFRKAAKQELPERDTSVIRALKARGITAKAAANFVEQFSKEHIEEKLQLFDDYVARKDQRISKNPAGFLASAITNDYKPLPKKKQIPERRRIDPPPQALSVAELESSKEFLSYWERLPIEEQAKLEREALSAAPKFHRDTLNRLHVSNSPLRQQMRLKLIEDFIKKNGS